MLRPLLASVLLLIASGPATPATETAAKAVPFLYTVAKAFEPMAWLHGADRFPSGAEIFVSTERGRHPLVPEFAASADPTVAFDGEKEVFEE